MPGQFLRIFQTEGVFVFAVVVAVGLVVIAAVVYVEQAQRRIPVQYAKRMVGSRMYGGASTYIPLKVNMAGVIPVIFASSLLSSRNSSSRSREAKTNGRSGSRATSQTVPSRSTWWSTSCSSCSSRTSEICVDYFRSNRSRRQHEEVRRFIDALVFVQESPRRSTEHEFDYVLTRLTLPGSVYPSGDRDHPFIAFGGLVRASHLSSSVARRCSSWWVSDSTPCVKQIESQLQQRNYEGFLVELSSALAAFSVACLRS